MILKCLITPKIVWLWKTLNIYSLVASEISSKHSTKVSSPAFDCELKNNAERKP